MSSSLKNLRAFAPLREILVVLAIAAVVAQPQPGAAVLQAEETTCHGSWCPLPRRLVPVRPHSQPGAAVPQRPHPAVARIVNAAHDGRYHGSGTLIRKDSRRGIVLTCAHLFRNGTGKVTVAFPDGRRFEAEMLAIDSRWDLAVLAVAPPPASPVAIAREPPRVGDPLKSCGYGPDGRYCCNQGYARGYVRAGGTSTRETLELSGTARGGDSGGPVFNARGQLAAVLWGTDGRTVGGTYCGRIRKFLARILRPPSVADTPPPGAVGEAQSLGARLEKIRSRVVAMERAISVIGALKDRVGALGDRIERTEAVASGDNIHVVARAVALDVLAERAPDTAAKWLPGLLAALGWTGPPALAAIVAARILLGLRRRRRKVAPQRARRTRREGKEEGKDDHQSRRPLHDDYAEQLAGVFALSGRSPIADATLGREYDEELRRAAASSDAALAMWARRLRDRVANKFYRIHDAAPSPAEPIEK